MKDERETKEKLLQSARAEFLAKGYQGASLRSICKASGVTTGALYFFFKDKDDLFTSLVAPQLNTLKAMLTEHMRQELLVLDSGEDAAENDFRDDAYASQQVLHLLYQNYDLFLLLLTGSYGSSLEHFVDELVAISEEHYRKLADRQAALLGVTPPQDWNDVEQVRTAKKAEIGLACSAAIYAGIDVGGAHYSLTEHDQTELMAQFQTVKEGAEEVPYHADGELCRMYTAEEFTALTQAATAHVFYHRTYCNHLNAWIKRAGLDEIPAIVYGADLPAGLAASMAALIEKAGGDA